MYAATDSGDTFQDSADFLFCDSKDVSIDIFGLNVERWVNSQARDQYTLINKQVEKKHWPGVFLHSEEGGPYGPGFPQPARTWDQLPAFFTNWTSINGFFAYAYYGKKEFDMFDG